MKKQVKKARLVKTKPLNGKSPEPKMIVDSEGNIIGTVNPDEGGQEPESKAASQSDHVEKAGAKTDEKSGKPSDSKLDPEETLSDREQMLKEENAIYPDFPSLKRELEEKVGLNISFDVVFREMVFGGVNTGIFYYNGFGKDTVLTEILERLSYADRMMQSGDWQSEPRGRGGDKERESGNESRNESEAGVESKDARPHLSLIDLFDKALIPHVQVKLTENLNDAVKYVASGGTAFFFEGETKAVLVDAKTFPARNTEEPDLERVVRGSRDGFVETLLTNVTLVRRRIRDPRLKLEIMKVAERTQTDVCIAYIHDICDNDLVESIRDKIKQVKVDGLPLGEKQLEEAMIGKGWNPYPMVRFSERPDVISAHLLEGHVCVFVDTSPSVMILPTTFFHHVQHVEEYRQSPTIGTYLRWVRFAGIFASLFLLPLWFLIAATPEIKPAGLEFLGPEKLGAIPLIIQFLIAELGIDLMRMAAVHTPTPLATAMGLVAAILIGDIAVKTGLFANEVILYLAVAAIGTFATPSYELSLANRLSRLVFLLAAALFSVPGLVVAATLWVIMLVTQRSYNAPYMWPFLPFNAKAIKDIVLRRPFNSMKERLSLTKPLDSTRRPEV